VNVAQLAALIFSYLRSMLWLFLYIDGTWRRVPGTDTVTCCDFNICFTFSSRVL